VDLMAEVEGGYILLSRKLVESEIWDKPPIYLKVWMYILTKAQHKPYKNLDRGELLISIPELIEVCSYKVGYRIEKPSKTQIFNILEWLRNSHEGANEDNTNGAMIHTTKTTRGMVVKVRNYKVYQDPKNYERNAERNDEETMNGTMVERQADTINKNDKNDKNDKKETPSPKQVYDEDSIPFRLSNYLYRKILINNPEHKQPNIQSWSDDFRKLIELDKRTPKEIGEVIDFAQSDSFWSTNILSASKLRKQYDALNMKRKQVGQAEHQKTEKPKAFVEDLTEGEH